MCGGHLPLQLLIIESNPNLMTYWIENYFICFCVSVLLAGIIIPNIMTIAFRRKLFDEIDERKIHKGVVPRLGGIAFLPSFIFSFCMVVGCNIRLGVPGFSSEFFSAFVPVFFLLCSLMLLYLVGIADDLIGVRYRAKFVFQIIAGALIVISGSWIHNFYGFIGIHHIPTIIGWVISIFLVIYVVNAINKGWLEGWKMKGFAKVKNPDLWSRLVPLLSSHRVAFHWIKGHAGHPENERCDALAVAAGAGAVAAGKTLPPDPGYLPE